jgi:hypothetical protein
LESLRVLVLNGPRQAGETTFLQQVIATGGGALRSLDDEFYLRAARDDPVHVVTFCVDACRQSPGASRTSDVHTVRR